MSAHEGERAAAPRSPDAPASATRIPALIVMHADLGEAMLRAAEKVYGPVEGVEVLSNDRLSRESLEDAIASLVDAWPAGGLVLTDFWGGSCHLCGATAARGKPVVILTGCNLSMLLDYLHNRETHGAEALADRLLQKGQQSIRLQRGRP
jgi:D-glucosaminate-specific PTS system IIA component